MRLVADLLPRLAFWMEHGVDYYVPIIRHLEDDVLLLKSGAPFAMVEVTGARFETDDEREVVQRVLRLNQSYKQVTQDGLIFYVWETRSADGDGFYPEHTFDNPTAGHIDRAYLDHVRSQTVYENRKFFGIELREEHPIVGEMISEDLLPSHTGGRGAEDVDPDRLAALKRIVALLTAELAPYRPRRLGVRIEQKWVYSEIAEALALAATGIKRKIPLTTGPLNESMFREIPTFYGDTIRFLEPDGEWFALALGMKHFPKLTYPGMLSQVLAAPYPCTLLHSFRCVPTEVAKSIMSRRQSKLQNANDPAIEQGDALTAAANGLGNADYILGDYAFTLLGFAATEKQLGEVATRAWGHLADAGVTVSREHYLSIRSMWASIFPGNAHHRPRPGYVTSRNFSAMAPLHNYDTGRRSGHWGKPALVLRLPSGEPFYYHIHVNDLGNTFVCGPSGSGKTSLLGMMIAQSARCRVKTNIVYDKDRGLKVLIKALGGSYIELGGAHLAPLKRLTAHSDDMSFLLALIRAAIMRDGKGEISSEDDRKMPIGLRNIMELLPPEERWLEELCGFLGNEPGGAGERLAKWCWGNELGWVFDAPEDKVAFDGWINAFDQTTILDDAYARGPTIAILHYYTTKLLDGRRLLETFDEVNKSMSEPAFVPLINNALRVIRKLGGATILATQSPHDVVINEQLSHVIREQIASAFYAGNARGKWADYDAMGATEHEFDLIRNMPPGTGQYLLKQGAVSHRVSLPLPEKVAALISGREEATKLFDRIYDETERDIQSTLARWHKERRETEEIS